MPSLQPCASPRCPTLVRAGHCPAHASQREARRGSASQRGYDWRWQRYARWFKNTHPLCGDADPDAYACDDSQCRRSGRVTPVVGPRQGVVHHIRGHRGADDPLFMDPRNHMSLCARCHNQVTDEGDFGRSEGRR
jgi:5-methylcytosine-specific restriction enzyme A